VTPYRTTRFFAALALAACWLATGLPLAFAGEPTIVIVGPQTKTPYKAFVEGFKGYMGEQESSPEFFDMNPDTQDASSNLETIVHQSHVPLILSLGAKAFQSTVESELHRPIIASLLLDRAELDKHDNVTGVVLEHAIETQLLWIKRILPEAKTIGVLYNPAESGERIAAAKKSASKLNIKLIAQEVNSPQELPVAMDSLFRRVDVLWGIADPVVLSRQTAKAVLLTSFRNKVPFIAPSSAWVKAGALYSLEFDYQDLGEQSGEMALSVLRGQPVNSIPPQTAREVKYSLNLRTAEHMRLNLPNGVVDGATRVFE
jgi:putative ABC transport system substrate-binding protein